MSEVVNSAVRVLVAEAQLVAGVISQTAAGTGISFTELATALNVNLTGDPDYDQPNCSLTRNSIGNYTLAIANFKGPTGIGICSVSAATTGVAVALSCPPATYSGTTASFTITAFATSTGAAVDTCVGFTALTF